MGISYDKALEAAREKAAQAGFGSPFRFELTELIPRYVRRYCPDQAKILDLGCGSGRYAYFFVEAGVKGVYTGIDIDPHSLDGFELSDLFSSRLLAMDAHDLSSMKETFDFLLSVTAFEHFENDRKVAAGMAQVMRPGAHALVVVPSHYSYALYGRHGYRRYSPASLSRLAKDADLDIVEMRPVGGAAGFLFHFLWFFPAHAARLAAKSVLFLLYGFNRGKARADHPRFFAFLEELGNYHLKRPVGRFLHRLGLRMCRRFDALLPILEVGYLAVFRKP